MPLASAPAPVLEMAQELLLEALERSQSASSSLRIANNVASAREFFSASARRRAFVPAAA